MGMESRAKEKFAELRHSWIRQIANELMISMPRAARVVDLAEINGLFDAAKATFAREDD